MPDPIGSVVTPLGDAPNSPGLNADATQHIPALTDIGQALQLVRSLQAENREREKKNSRILERYNAERPYNPQQLRADGLGWKTNVTTKPLTVLIDRVVPRFTTAIKRMKYLTASQLPPTYDNAAEKSEAFQKEVSKTCRSHPKWKQLVMDVAQENSLFGYVATGWLDNYSWFPRYYNQDAFLAPQGTQHSPATSAVVCFRDSYLCYELFDMIRGGENAKLAGWNLENTVEAINNAVPDDRRSYQVEYARVYADLVRESAILSSFTGAKSVIVWHVLVTEIDGRVTHVAFDDRSGKQLFWKNKQFDRMADAAAFFTFQHGNGRIHGSKGIGRELYNLAVVIDRSRNEMLDRLQLSGKVVLRCDEREIKRFRMSVMGNAILIGNNFTVENTKIDSNAEAFFDIDKFLTNLLNEIAGNVSASPTDNIRDAERVTGEEVNLVAQRESESRDILIERFLEQFADFMTTIQKRLCNAEAIDQDAKDMQARLLKIMSREELDYLASQPAIEMVADYSDLQRQAVLLWTQQVRGNPAYNQVELEREAATAAVDKDFADKVVLPVNDATEVAENVRQQSTENLLLQNGHEVPVSPRDNHLIHLKVLQQSLETVAGLAAGNPKAWQIMELLTAHGMEHVGYAEKRGTPSQQIAPFRTLLTKAASTLIKLHQSVPSQASGGAPDQTGAAAPQGQPVGATPPEPVYAPIHEAIAITYKDLPPDVQRQVEAKLGLNPSNLPPAAPAAPSVSTSKPATPKPATSNASQNT